MQQLDFELKPSNDGSEPFIELNKLLKYMQVVENGAMANAFIAEGLVKVNNQVDTRKRAKIRKGDSVIFENTEIKVL